MGTASRRSAARSCSDILQTARGRARRRPALPHRGRLARGRPGRRRGRREQHAARAYGFEPSLDRAQGDLRVVRHRPRLRVLHVPHRRDRPAGVVQVHAYPFSDTRARSSSRRATGAARSTRRRARRCSATALIENRTRWINFVTVRNPFWRARERRAARRRRAHRALLDRLGHQARDGGRDLAGVGGAEGDIDAYEAERRPIVESTQRAAQGSLEWFEGIGRYVQQDPETFAFNLLTRSRRITFGELRMRDPDFVASVARRAADVHAASGCARWSSPTASSSRRWTCTPRSTARPATSTSCTSARARSAAPGW